MISNDRCQTSKENQTHPPSDYDIYIKKWMNLKRKYTFPYIEIKSFSAHWTDKSCSIEQINHYFQLSSLACYFQAGRRKEMEGEPLHKSFQDTDCKYDFQKTPQSHCHGFKTHSSLDFDHLYKLRSIDMISALFDHRRL